MRRLAAFFILFQGMLCLPGTTQTYFFDNYSTPQGFESKVYAVAQDKQHQVWLGTQTGLSRFDGNAFVAYAVEDGLAQGGVRVLFIDRDEMLWMGHEGGGITRYNGRSFEKVIFADSLIRSNITSICQDQEQRIWLTTELDGALCIRNPRDPAAFFEYEHYLQGKSLGDQVYHSLVTTGGDLFFITGAGIRKYNPADNSFATYAPRGMFTYFSFSVMFEDRKKNLWFGTHNGGLSKLDHETGQFSFLDTRNGLASNWITTITEDRKGNIWVGHWKNDVSPGGISRISPDGQIRVFTSSNGLHDEHIWCIREDHEGNMLIGTTEQGLDIFKGEAFISFSTTDGLLHNQVNAVTEDVRGQIWFGTSQGISIFAGEGRRPAFQHYNQSNHFIPDLIRSFRKDRNNNIWIGTADQGVWLYQAARGQFVPQPRINSYLPYYQTLSKGITALEIGPEGHLWIGTIEGLVEYDISRDEYVATYTQSAGLAGNQITALYTDSRGVLWIGSDMKKGLTRMQHGAFTIIPGVQHVTPTSITEDREGKIWVGTESRGVLLLDADSVRHYGIREGLLSNLVNLLVCDAENNVYVGTNRGLNRIDQQGGRILAYTRRVGFTGIETKQNAWMIDSRGFLWLGTANGAMRCDLALLVREDTLNPEIRISEMRINGNVTELLPGRRLSSTQNDVSFRYHCISLTYPEGVTYQVMLQGHHDTWQDQQNENTMSFEKLQPGRYTFLARARNGQGKWTTLPASYSFRILPPFYQRGYFILSVILLALGAIIAFIRIREKNLVQEKKILEDKVRERTLELSVANDQLSMRNRDITDSITYAKRIQFAILPPDIPFDNTFILFRPKDIVSGDFYWLNAAGGREFLAAVDCTGHGVPGAFMSFIGFTSLNKIIIEQGIYQPSLILDRLNEEVAVTLHQKGEDIVNDGMDIALVCYNPESGMLEYAGAFNPLIIARNGEIIEIKADRFAIGRATGREKTFTNHELHVNKGDSLYLFSDGYADQFGGASGKKFKISALKELLATIGKLGAERQKEILENTFDQWKVNQTQIDDVLIVGRKF